MAQAGGAAGGGAGGGGGAGEQDVPDVRFLFPVDKIDVNKRSKSWKEGNENSPLKEIVSVDEKEKLLITFFQMYYNLSDADLFVRYAATGEVLLRQPPDIIERNNRACDLCTALGRKRRLAKFLMILYQAISQRSKQLQKIQVPRRYSDPGQLKGDIRSLKEGCKTLFNQIVELCAGITRDNGIPIDIPQVFGDEIEVPKSKK